MNNSLWNDTTTLLDFPSLDGSVKTDVLIIGGGLAGVLTAFVMERAGVDYLLIEADRICKGISQNTTAKITSQHGLIYHKLIKKFGNDLAYKYWSVQEAALDEYRRLSQKIACDFEAKAAYVYAVDDTNRMKDEMAALKRLGIPAEYVKELPLLVETAGAIRFKNQAQFHPLKFTAGIVRGLNIREHTAAQEFKGSTVRTNRGTITAKYIIIATHFPIINKHGSYFLKLYQDRSYVLAVRNAPDVNGMYLEASGQCFSFRDYGEFLLLGGGGHRTGKQGSGWVELESFADKYYPNADKAYRWATQDCMTLDGIPYIGQYSRSTPNLYVATGFNKWGMTSSMAAAMILCDLVQGKKNPYAEVFFPSRTMLHPQLVTNALEATANLLTISKPRCPHMGCALKWNKQEHSWDCPCHGSRFSEEGILLNNPSTGNLKGNQL